MTAWQAQAKNSFFEEEKWAGFCLWNPTPRVTAGGAGGGAVTPWEAMGARARGAPRPRERGRPQWSGRPGRGTRAHGPRQGRSDNRFLFSVSKSEAMCVIARERGKVNPRPAVPALRPQHEAAFHFARSLSF